MTKTRKKKKQEEAKGLHSTQVKAGGKARGREIHLQRVISLHLRCFLFVFLFDFLVLAGLVRAKKKRAEVLL